MLESAIDKKIEAVGLSGNTPGSKLMYYPLEGEKGSTRKQRQMPSSNPVGRGETVKKNLVSKLPHMRKNGEFTDPNSSDEEEHEAELMPEKEEAGVEFSLTELLRKQITDQQEQMAIMAKEFTELQKDQRELEKSHMGEPTLQPEGGAESSVAKTIKRIEVPQIHINLNSPFSKEMQVDPLPNNFKTMVCEYQGQGDPEEHLLKFESICLLHQY